MSSSNSTPALNQPQEDPTDLERKIAECQKIITNIRRYLQLGQRMMQERKAIHNELVIQTSKGYPAESPQAGEDKEPHMDVSRSILWTDMAIKAWFDPENIDADEALMGRDVTMLGEALRERARLMGRLKKVEGAAGKKGLRGL